MTPPYTLIIPPRAANLILLGVIAFAICWCAYQAPMLTVKADDVTPVVVDLTENGGPSGDENALASNPADPFAGSSSEEESEAGDDVTSEDSSLEEFPKD
jgi:hypothetical protein